VKLNSSKLVNGEESPPIPIGGNGETVNLVITISAPNHSSNKYYLSVYRSKYLKHVVLLPSSCQEDLVYSGSIMKRINVCGGCG
jgi:hypothetical protein